MAAAGRIIPAENDSTPKDHVEWKAVEEGFRLLERDLAKLQVKLVIVRLNSYSYDEASEVCRNKWNWIPQDPQKVG
jgi:hypothetical protein